MLSDLKIKKQILRPKLCSRGNTQGRENKLNPVQLNQEPKKGKDKRSRGPTVKTLIYTGYKYIYIYLFKENFKHIRAQ